MTQVRWKRFGNRRVKLKIGWIPFPNLSGRTLPHAESVRLEAGMTRGGLR